MKNKKYIFVGLIVLAIVVFGFVSMNSPTMKEFFPPTKYSNTEPMNGALSYEDYIANRGSGLKKADDDFVKKLVEKMGSNNAVASVFTLAVSSIEKKDFDTAMKRCNQAWLIEHTNFNVYWCYGAVLGSKNDLKQSALYFEKALSMYSASSEFLVTDHLKLFQDASIIFVNLSDEYLSTDQVSAKKYATKAINLLSTLLEDKNLPKEYVPITTMGLAAAYFNNGSYAESRNIYNDAVNKYYTESDTVYFVGLDQDLKEKGF